jgi:hypothetical protein
MPDRIATVRPKLDEQRSVLRGGGEGEQHGEDGSNGRSRFI